MWRMAIWTACGIAAWSVVLIGVALFDALWGAGLFFGPLESILYASFYPTMTLAALGLAASGGIGLSRLLSREANEPRAALARPWLTAASGSALLLAFSVHGVDEGIRSEQRDRFRAMAQRHLDRLAPHLAEALPAGSSAYGRPLGSDELDSVIAELDELQLVRRTTLYLPDPDDQYALWHYRPDQRDAHRGPWKRILVDEDHERAIRAKFRGNSKGIDHFNEGDRFVWIEPLTAGDQRAILVVLGHEQPGLRRRAAAILGA